LTREDLHEPGTGSEDTIERVPLPGTTVQQQHRRCDGTKIEVEVVSHQFSFKGDDALVLVCTDVTHRKEAENQAAVFTNLGQRLSLARTQQEAARIIVDAADALFGWDACTFDMVSPTDGSLTMVLGLDLINGERKEVPLINTKPGPISRKVLSEGAQLELRRPGYQRPQEAVPFGDTGRTSSSIMGVPLRRDENVIGLLSIQSYTLNAYTETDLRTLQALADHCGGAIERIRAEEEVGRLNRELRQHLEELQALFAVAPVGIAVATDPELTSVSVNEAAKALFGISNGEELTQILRNDAQGHCTIRHEGRVLRREEFPMHRAVQSGAAVEKQEIELHSSNGGVVYCYAYATALFGDYGEIRGSLGIFVDLTARKQAEDEILRLNSELELRVRERTIQLEAMNKELEAFSYSVSHDLRAPLRSIRGFSEVLLERYRDKLDARGQEFLRRACESCAHMDRLIEDLLKLSRVGRAEIQRQHVNLSGLATTILEDLQKAEPQRTVECLVMPGLFAPGDERLLRVALDNLLRNSWKFTLKTEHPQIEFGFIPEGEGVFYVRDNGAGFDPAFSSRLFSVFQRLHSASEFPGTGVGLATVQRIVSRHGGRTWARGQVNQGACFYFTLPEGGPESELKKEAVETPAPVAEQVS
jgi:PAS domain S-box-containing protein